MCSDVFKKERKKELGRSRIVKSCPVVFQVIASLLAPGVWSSRKDPALHENMTIQEHGAIDAACGIALAACHWEYGLALLDRSHRCRSSNIFSSAFQPTLCF